MNKADKLFKIYFYGIVLITLLAFILVFFWQLGSISIKENFLTSASVAGFVGLFGQFALMLIQEYYKRRVYNICMVCKKSQFSLALVYGVQEYYAKKADVRLEVRVFDAGQETEQKLLEFLNKDAHSYDGLIIRPVRVSDSFVGSLYTLLKEKKKVLLVDLNLSQQQEKSLYTEEIPYYVGSDFSKGGQLVATCINQLVKKYTKEQSRIILFLGPEEISSARKRSKSLLWHICSENNQDICDMVILKNFHPDECLDLFITKLNEWKLKESDNRQQKHVIIFCGNDNVAKRLMELTSYNREKNEFNEFITTCKSATFIGYDGIKDNENNYQLSHYGIDYATIDVLPDDQGRTAADLMYKKLTSTIELYKTEIFVDPKLVTEVKENL